MFFHHLKILSATDYAEWVERRREAEVALEDREKKLFETSRSIESQLELLGKNTASGCVYMFLLRLFAFILQY